MTLHGQKSLAALLVVVLVVATVPTVVTAQAIPHSVFLDQDTRKIASITVDGQTYEVYHHDNLVPYASGIGIYTGGDRVTSEATAREVLTALAQRRAVEELGPADVKALRTSKRNVSATAPNVSEAAQTIDETLAYLVDLKTVRVDGTTAYNASVEAAPAVTEFNETARELLPELRSFGNASDAYTANATKLINLLEQRANGTTVDPQTLYDRYAAALQAKNDLSDHLDFNGIGEQLAEVASLSATIAKNVSTVPERGEEIARQFATVQNTSALAANQTATLELPGFEFEEVQETAESLASEWMDQWRTRQGAAMDVYKTIAGIGIAIVAAIGYVKWRRR